MPSSNRLGRFKLVTLWWVAVQVTPIQWQKEVLMDQFFAKIFWGSEVMCALKASNADSSVKLVLGIAKEIIKNLISNTKAKDTTQPMLIFSFTTTVICFKTQWMNLVGAKSCPFM